LQHKTFFFSPPPNDAQTSQLYIQNTTMVATNYKTKKDKFCILQNKQTTQIAKCEPKISSAVQIKLTRIKKLHSI